MNSTADSIDLKEEVRGIRIAAAKAATFCAICLGAGYYLLPHFVLFPTNTVDVLIFTLRVDVFILLWVVFGIGLVARARRQSTADIRGSAYGAPTPKIKIKIAFLQNTLEQAIVSIGAHMVLSTLVSGAFLSFIVVGTVLFGIGRISFYRGYPRGAAARAFGMVTTVLPAMLALALAITLMLLKLLTQ